MKFTYKITHRFLNTVDQFNRLHGALYMMGSSLPWKEALMDITGTRAALSAAALDSNIEFDDLIKDQINVKIPKEFAERIKNYRKAKDSLDDTFGTIDSISLDLFHTVNKSIMGIKSSNQDILRRKTRLLPKAVYEDGIYRKVDIIVKTKPDQILPQLEQLNDWIKENYKILNPIIKAAIVYYLLARIHPYADGNGRTAKIFIHGILYQNGIDQDNLLILEEYYLKNRTQYYDKLAKSIETEDLTDWFEFFVNALNYGAIEACKVLYKLSGGSIDILKKKFINLSRNQIRVINALQKEGRSTGAKIGRDLSLSRQYINNVLNELISLGIVEKQGIGRGSIYSLITSSTD